MILYTPNIENTEASTVPNRSKYAPTAKITKLAGAHGETDIWLYNAKHQLNREPGEEEIQHRLGLQLYINHDFKNTLLFNTWKPLGALHMGDSATFYFHGGESWRGYFLVGGMQEGKRKRNLILIDNETLLLFREQQVTGLELLNHKNGRHYQYTFLNYPNQQYKNAAEGGRLLQVMFKRIIGVKEAMGRHMLA